jgi:photosystem II stability/assembly factor-like uncharacterized protein
VDIAISESGVNISALTSTGPLYMSFNSGSSWLLKTYMNDQIASIDMSDDGIRQTIVSYNGSVYNYNSDTGTAWVLASTHQRQWQSISLASDGITQSAVANNNIIYTSTDTGVTWSSNYSTRDWQSVSVSENGLTQVAVASGEPIHISVNAGNTWTSTDSARDWVSIAVSGDGNQQTAIVENGLIYNSTDAGTTWTPVEEIRSWKSIDMSSDGVFRSAVAYNDYIYVSSDSGSTWSSKDSIRNWQSINLSLDGVIQMATADNDYIYRSTDSGETWVQKNEIRDWRAATLSGDGIISTAVAYDDQIHINSTGCSIIELNVKTNQNNKLVFSEIGDGTLNNINMMDMVRYYVISVEESQPQDLFIPPGSYTIQSLVDKINQMILSVNPSYIDPFTYDVSTGKISFTSIYSGDTVLTSTDLLQKLGLTEIPVSITSDVAIEGSLIASADISGPANLFIKSDVIAGLKKNKTAFSTNQKLENIIAQLTYQEDTNTFIITIPIELYLSKKEEIKFIDIQIVDEQGNIINLNGGVVQCTMYFISS